MAGVVSDVAESVALQLLVGKIVTPEALVLRLFTNDIVPDDGTLVGALTEATGSGYAAITLTGAKWLVSSRDPTVITYDQQTFSFTGALGNVVGYYLTRASSGDLIAAERFSDGPYNIGAVGDTILINPRLTAL